MNHFTTVENNSELPKKTVDQDDLDLIYQETFGWGHFSHPNLGSIWIPENANRWEDIFHRFYCERIVFIREFGMLALRFGGYDYNIPLERIETERDLLAWVRHLSFKHWATAERLRLFMDAVSTIKEFEITDPYGSSA
jgi:hypothetical protein